MPSKETAANLFNLIRTRKTTKATLPKGYGLKGTVSVDDLAKADQLADSLENIRERKLPPTVSFKPTKNYPAIANHYVRGGQSLDMCPYQLEAAIIGILDSDNELILGALKKLLATGKLADERVGEQIDQIKKSLRRLDDEYDQRINQYDATQKAYLDAVAQKDKDTQDARKECLTAWSDIVTKLSDQMKKEPRIENLGDEDRWLARAFQYYDLVEEVKSGKKVGHRVVVAKALRIDELRLREIIARYATIQEDEHSRFISLYLETTPTDELRAIQWQVRDPDDRDMIEEEIINRRALAIQEEEERLRFMEYRHNLIYSRRKYGY